MRRCVAIAGLLTKYHEKNGSYPESLHDLVDGGLITPEAYHDLMFQPGPRAQSQEWCYLKPSAVTDFAVYSGEPVFPWKGASGMYLIGSPDGGCQKFTEGKIPFYIREIERSGRNAHELMPEILPKK